MSNDIRMQRIARKMTYRFGEAAHAARERAEISDSVRRYVLSRDVARHYRRDQASMPEASMMDDSNTGFLSARELLIGLSVVSPLLLVLAFIVQIIRDDLRRQTQKVART